MKRSKLVEKELAEVAAEKAANGKNTADKAATKPEPKATKKGSFGKAPKGTTVADLQKSVDETAVKTNGAAKSAKPAKKSKAAKKNSLAEIFGHSVAAVARALGNAGWMPADAIAAIHSIVPKASPLGIRTYVQAGKQGLRGDPAELTKKQLAELEAAAKAAA